MKNKSYSESETDLLTASTDTLATKKDFPMEVRHDARKLFKFLWNSEEDAIMGKTETNWARLLLFYVCFMSALAAYAAIVFAIYLEVRYFQFPMTLSGNIAVCQHTAGSTDIFRFLDAKISGT